MTFFVLRKPKICNFPCFNFRYEELALDDTRIFIVIQPFPTRSGVNWGAPLAPPPIIMSNKPLTNLGVYQKQVSLTLRIFYIFDQKQFFPLFY